MTIPPGGQPRGGDRRRRAARRPRHRPPRRPRARAAPPCSRTRSRPPSSRPRRRRSATLQLERRDGRVDGVRFTLGAFERGDPLGAGTRVALTERLALTLVDAGSGRVVRRLTPPGGARELLPAEYEYTLPAGTLRDLGRGRYAFRAVARRPRGGEPADARSEPFAP